MGVFVLFSCKQQPKQTVNKMKNFGEDVAFLQKHKEVTVLENENKNAKIAIVGAYQARVMTSTANGDSGMSHGWMNYDLIKSGEQKEHINAFGGENRFWMGPEAGQYAIFFEKGKSFDIANWYTPASIDYEPFQLIKKNTKKAIFGRDIRLKNYADFTFDINVKRTLNVFENEAIQTQLGVTVPDDVKVIGYGSTDKITNKGKSTWKKETGLLSIWVLGVYKPSSNTVVIVPYRGEANVNTAYFGTVGGECLKVTDKAVFFKGDGTYRSKIGLPPENAKPVIGSYSAQQNLLTIVKYSFNQSDKDYVNSLWKMQDNPYGGDVVNSYNDGPMEDGSVFGPFYELETSSPAKELAPEESVTHEHFTFHFEGSKEALDKIAFKVLGIHLNEIPAFDANKN